MRKTRSADKVIYIALIALILLLCSCAAQPGVDPGVASSWQEQYDLGMRYLSQGNYREAVIAFNSAIEIDPKRSDAYIGLSDAYIGLGDTDSAINALREGYTVTGDERLRRRVEEIQSSRGTGPGSDVLPAELTVLLRMEAHVDESFIIEELDAMGGSTWNRLDVNSYNEDGYQERLEVFDETFYHYIEETMVSSHAWNYEYSPDYSSIRSYYDGDGKDVYVMGGGEWIDNRISRGRGNYIGDAKVYCNPYPGAERPVRVELEPLPSDRTQRDPSSRYIIADDEKGVGAYAVYEYDEAGNAVKITTYYASGQEVGFCVIEWGTLVLGHDGKYHLQYTAYDEASDGGAMVYKIFTSPDFVKPDELTLLGDPFYKVSYNRVLSSFSGYMITESTLNDGNNFTAWIDSAGRHKDDWGNGFYISNYLSEYDAARYHLSERYLTALIYGGHSYKGFSGIDIPPELRGLRLDDTIDTVMTKLGIAVEDRELLLSYTCADMRVTGYPDFPYKTSSCHFSTYDIPHMDDYSYWYNFMWWMSDQGYGIDLAVGFDSEQHLKYLGYGYMPPVM